MLEAIKNFLDLVYKLPIIAQLSGPIQSASARFVRVVIGIVMAVLLSNAASGTLFPAQWGQVTIVVLGAGLVALDKWLRDKGWEAEAKRKAAK